MRDQPTFLPISEKELSELGIDQLDIVLVSGDAYVDHPSFGVALIGRSLWHAGYRVGIVAQPDWRKDDDFIELGEPRLFFGISSGNVDSMVNNYTPNLKRRSRDVYSPGGALYRPDRSVIVYTNKIHALFPNTPMILGGLEASLRRFAHYDYWSDSVRQSILADAPADLLVFGMGELPILDVAKRLDKGEKIQDIVDIPGTVIKEEVRLWKGDRKGDYIMIPDFKEVSSNKKLYAEAFRLHYAEQDPVLGRTIVQPHPKTVVIQNKPARPLSSEELDQIYELPYCREAHPSYGNPVPALEPVKFSITSHRGCFGSCSFCALTHHQGRIVQSRSIESILREARMLTKMKSFKGIIQDVGGPTANMYGMTCSNWKRGACIDKYCINCSSLDKDHKFQVEMLRQLRSIPGVKKVFISSGIRYDLIEEESSEYLEEVCEHHVSGHLKIAPEHVSAEVIKCMHKPPVMVLNTFKRRFDKISKDLGRNQFLLPYFMSGHPGCTITDMIELAEYIRDNRMYTEQVQDFIPTPTTISSTMYYTGIDPFTMEPVYVPRDREKMIQRALIHYRNPKNYSLVKEGLKLAGREDLIGDCPKCLIPSRRLKL
ncbi:MAG: YgiQ family radical SAM protein [Methanotrichaceae archaeon]|nr:YgiQ family radical SAM protein [Methanotrichaceae archaeon]